MGAFTLKAQPIPECIGQDKENNVDRPLVHHRALFGLFQMWGWFTDICSSSSLSNWSGLLNRGCIRSVWKVIPLCCHLGVKMFAISDCMGQQHNGAAVNYYYLSLKPWLNFSTLKQLWACNAVWFLEKWEIRSRDGILWSDPRWVILWIFNRMIRGKLGVRWH